MTILLALKLLLAALVTLHFTRDRIDWRPTLELRPWMRLMPFAAWAVLAGVMLAKHAPWPAMLAPAFHVTVLSLLMWKQRFHLTPEGIEGGLGGKCGVRQMRWADVVAIGRGRNGAVQLVDAEARTLSLSPALDGFTTFARVARAQLPPAVLTPKALDLLQRLEVRGRP